VNCHDARAEGIQQMVGKWRVNERFGQFSAYDAGRTSSLDTVGFFGAVF